MFVPFVTCITLVTSVEVVWKLLTVSPPCPPMPPHVLMNFHGFLPGCGDSVANFWGRDAHEARLHCPDDVSGDMQEDEIPGGGLKPKSINYPDHGHHGNLPLQGKIPVVEPGIEPRTSWLVVRNPDH